MKRVFSLFLCLLMLIALFPFSALAEEDTGTGTAESEAGDAGTEDAGDPADFYISDHEIAMNAWETVELFTNLGGETVTWISENEEIASVDETGTVTAHSRGMTAITAIADLPGGPAEDSCEIEVLSTGYLCQSPDELDLSSLSVSMNRLRWTREAF